jgi:flagellar protein FlbD
VFQDPQACADHPAEMIRLHRLAHPDDEFVLNPDLILAIEGTPDTVITLTTHAKVIVAEDLHDVVEAVRQWRASILTAAVEAAPRGGAALARIRGAASTPGTAEERR